MRNPLIVQHRGETSGTMVRRFTHGVGWGGLSTAGTMVLQLLFLGLLARLLEPADFGLVAMANIAVNFLRYFAEMGIQSAIVQKPALEQKDIHHAVGLALVGGSLAGALLWVGAPMVALAFNSSALSDVIRALSVLFPVTALYGVSLGLLRRQYRFREIAVLELASYGAGYGLVAVVCAFLGFGVWSLVLGLVTQSALRMLLAIAMVRHSLRPQLKGLGRQSLFHFGSQYSAIQFIEFLMSNLASMVIGRFIGDHSLGIYNRAVMVTSLPVQQPINVLTRTLFPMLSEVQNDRDKTLRAALGAFFLTAGSTFPVCLGMAAAAPDLVRVLLGSKWVEAEVIVQILALAIPWTMLSHVAGIVCDAQAALRPKLLIDLFSLLLFLALIATAIPYGVEAVAVAVAIGSGVRFILFVVVLRRIMQISLTQLSLIGLSGLLLGGLVALCIHSVAKMPTTQLWSAWVRLLLEIGSGAMVLVVGLYVTWIALRRLKPLRELEKAFPVLRRLSLIWPVAVR